MLYCNCFAKGSCKVVRAVYCEPKATLANGLQGLHGAGWVVGLAIPENISN